MTGQNSISQWIEGAKAGDSAALNAIWKVYYPKLVGLASGRLANRSRRDADEEDIAVSVFESFFRAAENNRFPDLSDRDQLWRVLLRMTVRKTIDHQRRHHRQKHGGGKVRGESVFEGPDGERRGMAEVVGVEPTPELAAILCEQTRTLLELLDDEQLQQMAIAKLEGYSNAEIAQQCDCSLSTVERRLRLIRKKWSSQAD